MLFREAPVGFPDRGFPLWPINMGTLKGFPYPPALWLWRAKSAFAAAIMGTLKGFAPPFGSPPATPTPLASLGLAKPSRAGARRAELAGSPRD